MQRARLINPGFTGMLFESNERGDRSLFIAQRFNDAKSIAGVRHAAEERTSERQRRVEEIDGAGHVVSSR